MIIVVVSVSAMDHCMSNSNAVYSVEAVAGVVVAIFSLSAVCQTRDTDSADTALLM